MRTKTEHFLSRLNTEIDVLNYVDIDNIDMRNPFESIYQMIEDNGGFDDEIIYYSRANVRNEFYELEHEINSFFEALKEEEAKNENPHVGQFVFDTYYWKKRKIQAISDNNKLYFIGSEHEPVYRDEFIFPLPKKL